VEVTHSSFRSRSPPEPRRSTVVVVAVVVVSPPRSGRAPPLRPIETRSDQPVRVLHTRNIIIIIIRLYWKPETRRLFYPVA